LSSKIGSIHPTSIFPLRFSYKKYVPLYVTLTTSSDANILTPKEFSDTCSAVYLVFILWRLSNIVVGYYVGVWGTQMCMVSMFSPTILTSSANKHCCKKIKMLRKLLADRPHNMWWPTNFTFRCQNGWGLYPKVNSRVSICYVWKK
jgi:hypothetical protein